MTRGLSRLTLLVALTGTAVVGSGALLVGPASATGRTAGAAHAVSGPYYTGPAIQGPALQYGYSALHSPVATGNVGRKYQ